VRATLLPNILECWHFLPVGATSSLCYQGDPTQCAGRTDCSVSMHHSNASVCAPHSKLLVKLGTAGQCRCSTLTAHVLLVVSLCIGQSRVQRLLQPRLTPQAPGQSVELGGVLRLGAGGRSSRRRLSETRRSHCNSMGQTPGHRGASCVRRTWVQLLHYFEAGYCLSMYGHVEGTVQSSLGLEPCSQPVHGASVHGWA
jgi:hypothetical protein